MWTGVNQSITLGCAGFASAILLFAFVQTASKPKSEVVSASEVYRLIRKIENIHQTKQGERELAGICTPQGELVQCCKAISHAFHVVIITGKLQLEDGSATPLLDGLMGALAIAKMLLHLGKDVSVLTDECNEEALLSCSGGANIASFGGKLSLQSFPSQDDMDDMDWGFLEQVSEKADLVIAVGRAGPNANGRFWTTDLREMTEMVSPLHVLLVPDDPAQPRKIRSIGLCDSVNEVGIGKVCERLLANNPPATTEAVCSIPAEHLLVAPRSSWAAYSLCAAAVLYDTFLNSSTEEVQVRDVQQRLRSVLPTDEEETEKCNRVLDLSATTEGATDGTREHRLLTVDGTPLQHSLDLLDQLRRLL